MLRFIHIARVPGWQKLREGTKGLCQKLGLGRKSEALTYTVLLRYIAYRIELDLQLCNYAQKRRICRENSKYAPDKSFVAIFALAERLPTSATLHIAKVISLPDQKFCFED